MARNLGSAKLPPQLEKIKKSVKKAGRAIAKRIAEVTTIKPARARSEVKGRGKARRAITRTKTAAKRTVKAVARKSPRARK
jgi:hypothetical protein